MRSSTILKQAEFAKDGEVFSVVKLPHTWNAFDGQDGGNDYWRGLAHYKIDLIFLQQMQKAVKWL